MRIKLLYHNFGSFSRCVNHTSNAWCQVTPTDTSYFVALYSSFHPGRMGSLSSDPAFYPQPFETPLGR